MVLLDCLEQCLEVINTDCEIEDLCVNLPSNNNSNNNPIFAHDGSSATALGNWSAHVKDFS